MPELPPVKLKVELDTHELPEGAVEVKAFGEGVKRDLEPAGQAWVRFADSGEIASVRVSSATAKSRQDLDQLGERAKAFGSSMETDMRRGIDAVIKLGEDGSASIQKLSRDMGPLTDAASQASDQFLKMGPAGWAVAAAVAGLAGELSLALVPLGGFVVGLAGAVVTMGLALGVIGALGVGIVALAEHANNWAEASANLATANANLATATQAHDRAVRALMEGEVALQGHRTVTESQLLHIQDLQQKVTDTANALAAAQKAQADAAVAADNPFSKLLADLNNMATALGQQATPAAGQLLTLIDTFVPEIQNMGSALISWFGDRLPAVIPIATRFIQDFLTEVYLLGQGIGKWFDDFTKNAPAYEALFRQVMGATGAAVLGLLQNFARLGQWFLDHLPEMGAVSAAVVGGIGNLLQGLGALLGWVVEHYDQLDAAIGRTYQQFMTLLAPVLAEINRHQEVVRAATYALYAVLVLLAGALVAPMVGFGLMAAAIIGTVAAVLFLWDRLTGFLGWLSQQEFSWVVTQWQRIQSVIEAIEAAASRASSAVSGLYHRLANVPVVGGLLQAGVDIQNLIPRQGGGPMVPGRAYTVGEHGPETVLMGNRGAIVLPNAGQQAPPSRNVYVTVHAHQVDVDERRLVGILHRYMQLHA